MLVHALVTSIRASPEPSILLVLYSLDKVFANLVGGCTRIAVFAEDNAAQLLLVPILHLVGLFRAVCFLLRITGVGVQVLLGGLALNVGVVTKLALAALFATAFLEKETQYSLWVDTKGYLLSLDGLE